MDHKGLEIRDDTLHGEKKWVNKIGIHSPQLLV